MPDYIEPSIGIPLALSLWAWLAWLAISARMVRKAKTTNHEIRRGEQ